MVPDASVQPAVSVVLPTAGRTRYLTEAVRSLQAQSVREWELIVVDDGAPNPGEIEALLAGVRAIRIIHQESRHVAAARNAGCAAAQGEFITFLDDDDVWPERRLELQMGALRTNVDCVGCYGRHLYIDGEGEVYGEGPAGEGRQGMLSAGFHIGTLMVRRNAARWIGGFDPLLAFADDLDYCLRLAQLGPLVFIPEILFLHRRHEGNFSARALHLQRVGREVYERHYRIARLRGDRPTAAAIAATSAGNARYFGVEAAREARLLLCKGELREAGVQLGAAAANARAVARWTRRRVSR